jgi:hypothetical protein
MQDEGVIGTLALGLLVLQSPLAPAPLRHPNPLKGLVPYEGNRPQFPHSMQFNYIGFAQLVKGPSTYDWTPLENLLNAVKRRGCQTVFRVYLEYPNKTDGIPAFLVREGLKVHRYVNDNTQPLPPSPVETPDYENPALRRELRNFIAALGRKYDGDPRIGFITMGLLGTWGEWHTYPRNELWASKTVQTEVMDAYQRAFKKTPVLQRYPAGPNSSSYASNVGRPFGYHDDSFAWSTLKTGKKDDDWFFLSIMEQAGPEPMSRWKRHPIGGEIRPEVWGVIFDPKPGVPEAQDFGRCLRETHVSWLMDSGMFEDKQPSGRVERALAHVDTMGYRYRVTRFEARAGTAELDIVNDGVAPFYADWPVEWTVLANGKPGKIIRSGSVRGILPGETRTLRVPLARGRVALRVPNPMPGGYALRFANRGQDLDAAGWMTLGEAR